MMNSDFRWGMGETTVWKHLSNFIFDIDTGCVVFRSSKIPMCNLHREEKEFLEKAHIDVEEDDAKENINNDAAVNTNKTLQAILDVHFPTVAGLSRTTIDLQRCKLHNTVQSSRIHWSVPSVAHFRRTQRHMGN